MHDDLRSAWRSLRSTRTLTIAALVVLTLGIGATTAIFSVVDAVVLRGLPFDEHDRLVAVGERRVPGPSSPVLGDPDVVGYAAPQNYSDMAAQQRVFEAVAAVVSGASTLRERGLEPEDVPAQRVTSGFFDVLRVRPAIGRAFAVENEAEGNHHVAILSDGVWRRHFGGDPTVIGRTIALDDGRYEVIGVMPPTFAFPVASPRPTGVWVPYVVPPDERIRSPQRRRMYLQIVARLAHGVSLDRAQAQLEQIAASLRSAHPEWNRHTTLGVRPLADHLVGRSTRSWMMMLLGAVGLLLAIACANVANLLLARGTVRARELAVRAALGASRRRLMRQMMSESALLSAAGAAAGLLLAWWAVQMLRTSMPPEVPRVANIAVDARVLATAAGLAIATAVVCGVLPALRYSRPDLSTTLIRTSYTGSGGIGSWMRSALVVVEVALAVILLVGAALFIGSFAGIMRVDPGFDASHVLTAGVYPRFQSIGGVAAAPADASRELLELTERLAHVPGVIHAGAVAPGIPLATGTSATTFRAAGRPWSPQDMIEVRWVTADFHRALRIALVHGRFFEPTDRHGSAGVMIINQAAARKYFPGEHPIGRSASLEGERTIVGIVGNVRQTSLESEPNPEAYVPIAQSEVFGAELVIRTTGNPYSVLPAVKTASADVLPDVPLRGARAMEEVVARHVARRRLSMLLLGLFGLLGLVMSTVGLYGVMAYGVARRTREIGVRMALGSTRLAVMRMVLKNATALVGLGLAIGGAGAWFLSAAARAFLFQIEATDPRAFAAALIALSLAALVASAVPARRAASIDPAATLRSE